MCFILAEQLFPRYAGLPISLLKDVPGGWAPQRIQRIILIAEIRLQNEIREKLASMYGVDTLDCISVFGFRTQVRP